MLEKEKDKVEEQKVARYNSTPSPKNSEINVSIVNSRASNPEAEDKLITSLPNKDTSTNSLFSWNLRHKRKVTLPHVPRKLKSLKYQPEINIGIPPRVKEELFDKGLTPPFRVNLIVTSEHHSQIYFWHSLISIICNF